MKSGIIILICFNWFTGFCHGHDKRVDSLIHMLNTARPDTARASTLNAIAALLDMSNANINLGKFDEALENSNLSLTWCERLLRAGNGSGKTGIRSKIMKLKARTLRCSGIIYGSRGNYREALKNFQAALKIGEETGDKKIIAQCKSNIGLVYQNQGNYSEALKNYFAALKLNQETGDQNDLALVYGNLGTVYGMQGNYVEALKKFLASLKISTEIVDKQGIARCKGNIGLLYFYLGNFPEALKYQEAAVKMNMETGNKEALALNYGNIGNVYGARGNYPDALKNQLDALNINRETGDKRGIALNYGNIGIIYMAMGNVTDALKSQFAARRICEEIGDKPGIALSYLNIGEICLKQKNPGEASQYLHRSLALAEETGSLEIMNGNFLKLAQLDSIQGNFKNSLEHYKMYIVTRDSMFNRENTKKIIQAKMQYDFDEKEALSKAEQEHKDLLALKELQRQKLLRNFFIGVMGMVIVLSFFIRRIYRARQLLRLNDIRNKIAGDLHDDIGSTLNSISIYSEVARKNDEYHDEALEMIGDASRKVIEAMSDIVWTINTENDSFAKIIFRMKSLAFNLFRAKHIEFTFHADEMLNEKKLSMEERRNFYLIFKEAVNNLVKYSNATRASITLTNENNWIRLRLRDNGVGFDLSGENAGNGLKNMKRRADEMKADFSIESQPGEGTQVELNLKI